MKFQANEIEADDIAGESCHLCGRTIDTDDGSCWDVLVDAPGTPFHDQQRYYHGDCWTPDEDGDDA